MRKNRTRLLTASGRGRSLKESKGEESKGEGEDSKE